MSLGVYLLWQSLSCTRIHLSCCMLKFEPMVIYGTFLLIPKYSKYHAIIVQCLKSPNTYSIHQLTLSSCDTKQAGTPQESIGMQSSSYTEKTSHEGRIQCRQHRYLVESWLVLYHIGPPHFSQCTKTTTVEKQHIRANTLPRKIHLSLSGFRLIHTGKVVVLTDYISILCFSSTNLPHQAPQSL